MDHTRHLDIISPALTQNARIALIGAGGIGAATAIALGKMGIGHLEVYDPQFVEPENVPTQLLRISDLGSPKASSLRNLYSQLCDGSMQQHVVAVEENTDLGVVDIVISALDSISSRQEVWNVVRRHCEEAAMPAWYLDARMASEVFQLYTVDLDRDTTWYDGALMSLREEDVPDEACTAKATIYTAFLAAGHIAHQIKLLLNQQPYYPFFQHDIARGELTYPTARTGNG